MTEKLYYADPYQREFIADIVALKETKGRYHVVLDRTAFYPEGGGQPCDLGTITGLPVSHVYEESGEIYHVMGQKPEGLRGLACAIDWPRRFDHMQQHLGQHLLSAALAGLHGAETVGFHLGAAAVTVDTDRPLDAEQIAAAERQTNGWIAANLPVSTLYPRPEELAGLPLRKQPQVDEGIRLVHAEGADLTPCGGTHPRTTAEVGLVKVLSSERNKGGTRVTFVCGGRAVRDYGRKHVLVREMAVMLSAGEDGLPALIATLLQDVKKLQKENAGYKQTALLQEAATRLASAEQLGAVRLVTTAFEDRDVADVRFLAQKICDQAGVAALLGAWFGGTAQVVFACSKGMNGLNMAEILKSALAGVSGRGGGSPSMAQGSFATGNLGELTAFLDGARAALAAALRAAQ